MEVLKKIIIICICVFPVVGHSQITFYKKFTSGPFDQGIGIAQLPDSSYVVTGTSSGFNNESGQAYLMMVDSLGNQKWTKSYGGFGEDVGVRVIHVPGDGFFIAGYTGSTTNGDFDFVLFKTDLLGNLIWEKAYGGTDWDVLHDAALLDDGGLILVGETEGQLSQGKDIFMVRTSAVGDEIWTKTISTPVEDNATAVEVLSATEFVIGGNVEDFGLSKGMLASYHVDGTENWVEILDQAGVTTVNDITINQNLIYICGSLKNPTENKQDFWYAKADLNGVFDSHWFFQTYVSGGFYNTIAVTANGVYVGMMSASAEINPYPGGLDAFVQKHDLGLGFLSGFPFSAFDEDYINQMIVTNDGGIAFVGTVSDDDVNLSFGTNVMIVKMGPNDEWSQNVDLGLDLVSLVTQEKKEISIYPNPTRALINLPTDLENKPFELRNIQGKVVQSGKITPVLSLENLDTGIYFLRINDDEQIWSTKIIKH